MTAAYGEMGVNPAPTPSRRLGSARAAVMAVQETTVHWVSMNIPDDHGSARVEEEVRMAFRK